MKRGRITSQYKTNALKTRCHSIAVYRGEERRCRKRAIRGGRYCKLHNQGVRGPLLAYKTGELTASVKRHLGRLPGNEHDLSHEIALIRTFIEQMVETVTTQRDTAMLREYLDDLTGLMETARRLVKTHYDGWHKTSQKMDLTQLQEVIAAISDIAHDILGPYPNLRKRFAHAVEQHMSKLESP